MKHRAVLIASGFVGAVHSPVYYKQLEYGGETLTKESMKSKGIVTYLCVAFLGAWSFWLAGLIVASRVFQISASNPLFQVMVLPGAFMPAIAAVVTRRWVTREGFSDVGLHLNFRRCWRYLFGGYVLPIIVVGLIVALAILLGISQPDFSLHRSLAVLIPKAHSAFPRITPSLWAILIFQMMIVGVPLGTIVTWGEEFGWRGYLQLRGLWYWKFANSAEPISRLASGKFCSPLEQPCMPARWDSVHGKHLQLRYAIHSSLRACAFNPSVQREHSV